MANNMMKYFLLLLFTLVVLITNGQSSNTKLTDDKNISNGPKPEIAEYYYKITQSLNNTWGYDIYKNNKLMICQKNIPTMPGNEGFRSKSDAEKVAKLVIEKLRKGKMPPSVTKEELSALKVL